MTSAVQGSSSITFSCVVALARRCFDAPSAGAKTDRHPVRSGQLTAAETGTKNPPSGEASAEGPSSLSVWSAPETSNYSVATVPIHPCLRRLQRPTIPRTTLEPPDWTVSHSRLRGSSGASCNTQPWKADDHGHLGTPRRGTPQGREDDCRLGINADDRPTRTNTRQTWRLAVQAHGSRRRTNLPACR